MKSEIIMIEVMGQTQQHVIITNNDGSCKSFPVDETNPEYLAWLAEQEEK